MVWSSWACFEIHGSSERSPWFCQGASGEGPLWARHSWRHKDEEDRQVSCFSWHFHFHVIPTSVGRQTINQPINQKESDGVKCCKECETGWGNRYHHEFISYVLETSSDPKLHVIFRSQFQIRCKLSKNNEKWNSQKEVWVLLPCSSCLLICISWLVLLNYLLNKLG